LRPTKPLYKTKRRRKWLPAALILTHSSPANENHSSIRSTKRFSPSASEHPLAAAIVAGAEECKVALSPAEAFESVTGKGVKARVDGVAVMLGNRKLLDDAGVNVDALAEPAESGRADGQTVMFVAVDGDAAGIIGVADPIKETTPERSANCIGKTIEW